MLVYIKSISKRISSNLYKKYCGEILIREVENNGMVGFAYPVFCCVIEVFLLYDYFNNFLNLS